MSEENNYSGAFVTLGMLFVTCLLISNVIVMKLWAITDSIVVPASVILFPITYILSDVFTEVYGFDKARLVIWSGFTCNFIAVIAYVITIDLPYPAFFLDQDAFAVVFGMTPRVLGASFVAYLFGEFSNAFIMSKLKVRMKGEKLWLRALGSTVVGEALDSVIFILIAFAGTMSANHLISMMLFQYILKVVFEIILMPVTYRVVAILKKKEGIDTYDYNHKYSFF